MSTNKQNQLHMGLYQYAEAHGTSTYKGYRVDIDRFTEWAADHLGISPQETHVILDSLEKRKKIKASSLGKHELIIHKR
jgi:hypothetical protein